MKLTNEQIDDIMDSALRGISYWCDECQVVGEYLGAYASEQISREGALRLYDSLRGKWYVLTREKFVRGYNLYQGDKTDIDDLIADSIIQLALFGEEKYA